MSFNSLEYFVNGGEGSVAFNASLLNAGYVVPPVPIVPEIEQDELLVNASPNEGPGTLAKRDLEGACGFTTLQVRHVSNILSERPSIVKGLGASTELEPNSTVFIIAGGDAAGHIVVNTGSSPEPNSIIYNVTYANPYYNFPIVQITPINRAAAKLYGSSLPFIISQSNTGFAISSNDMALPPNLQFEWSYMVVDARVYAD